MKKHLLILLFFTALLFNRGFSQAQVDIAPDVSVKTLDSHTYRFYDILDEGKIMVINFFSTSCGPCQTYAPDFQIAYENFGQNQGDVFFLGNNYNGTNSQVAQFADIYGLTMPLTSGLEGGGNASFEAFGVISYPTVVVITPDYLLVEKYVWEPTAENITEAVVNAGGTLVGLTARSDYASNSVVISPNPVRDIAFVSFELDNSQTVDLQIADLTGRVLIKKTIRGNQGENRLEIDAENLADGTYLVTLVTGSKDLFTTKMVIR